MNIEFALVHEVILPKEERNPSRTVIAWKGAILFSSTNLFEKGYTTTCVITSQPTNQSTIYIEYVVVAFYAVGCNSLPQTQGLITPAASNTICQYLRL